MSWRGERDLRRAADEVAARMPEPLAVLARLAFNYRWAWDPEGPELFRRVDPDRWERVDHNPVRLLLESPRPCLATAAEDAALLERARALEERVLADLARPPSLGSPDRPVAFLCAEFGVHRSLPTYSGGLGVLAGDILKQASDQALPLVGVGILYRQGTFHQRLDPSGWQHEYWTEADPHRLPAALVTGDDGVPLTVRVPLRGREVVAQAWLVRVGRTPLYLLDADRPDNSPVDRWISARLYVDDRTLRLAQYALLGIGGTRLLAALGIRPSVVHLNEGHAALAALEVARGRVAAGSPFQEALAAARRQVVFTTHTPVPAGNEAYPAEEVRRVLGDLSASLGAGENEVLGLGRSSPEDPNEPVGLTVLGIRASRSTNAVSRVHGRVSRSMWRHLFGDLPAEDVPIGHVTNGVHLPSWMAPPMRALLDRHLGPGWVDRASDPATWEPVHDIPDRDLWAVRNRLRADLVDFVRRRCVADRLARGEPVAHAEAGAGAFDPGVLTLGFARRVAAYKRLNLLVHDRDRGIALLFGPHPMQLVLAGKAHPADREAKAILQSVFTARPPPDGDQRAVFVEDYDLGVATRLVWGCDVWINVPRPPLEASGTSGIKSALNGGLNLSVLDGWWEEGYDGSNGWAIPGDPSLPPDEQDARDAQALYRLLEEEVGPRFYDRGPDGVPHRWVAMIKASLATVGPRFGAGRMLSEYAERVYRLP